jgi:DNA-binding MarR family transcriptional regulator
LKVKEYADEAGDVNRPPEEDLQELVQLFAHVVQSQKRGGRNHPPQAFVDAFEQNHLGPRHVRVLMNLVFEDAQSVSRLAERIGLSLGTTSLMVGELSKAGLVERAEDEHDRRRTIVRLHPEHVDTMQLVFRERTEPMRRALERMDPSDRRTFMACWRVLAEEVDKVDGPGASESCAV